MGVWGARLRLADKAFLAMPFPLPSIKEYRSIDARPSWESQLLLRKPTDTRHDGPERQDRNNFDPTTETWFDTDQFSIPQRFTFGTLGRVHPSLRADFVESLDFSIFKNFKYRERLTVQFRAEWFNAFNHPIFNNPGTQVGRGGFGRVAAQANLPRQTQLALKIIF